ncbi:hypothetical protein EMWEY_00030100 [Eimeria maxima]|uniref:Uncharacterized protein n=1 Tax=Eimeria maxima TaxID=5804 RepID=U6MBG5_EIMMA|nr:hypothetical protein EMWEY_00030100 [Eimeria maxima]CDJ60398.1 hypothetical protein EMWEY_00030100 [Eimeria maxima]
MDDLKQRDSMRRCGRYGGRIAFRFAHGKKAVIVVKVSGEAKYVLTPSVFGVKVVLRSHDLSRPAPMCIAKCVDLSQALAEHWYDVYSTWIFDCVVPGKDLVDLDELKQGDGMRYFGSVVGDRSAFGVGDVYWLVLLRERNGCADAMLVDEKGLQGWQRLGRGRGGVERAVFVDKVLGEGDCVVRPRGFGVKAMVRAHYLSRPPPICVAVRADLSQ